jgi:hypothetical protein
LRWGKIKKQLIIIGIATLLICVGLSGCNSDMSLLNISYLQAHPNRYLGKEVKVKGLILVSTSSDGITIVEDNYIHMFYIKLNDVVSGWYYVTGIVKYGNLGLFGEQYYIKVTNLQAS